MTPEEVEQLIKLLEKAQKLSMDREYYANADIFGNAVVAVQYTDLER